MVKYWEKSCQHNVSYCVVNEDKGEKLHITVV